MRHSRAVALAFATLGFACGGDGGTGPSATYESIASTYSGAVAGITQGIVLQSTLSITITQSAGALGGSFGLSGTLSDGVSSVQVQGTGSLAGTIASGGNPSVNITATSGICPNVRNHFSGAYDSVNRVITLNGSVNIFNLATCQVLLTYPGTIILRR